MAGFFAALFGKKSDQDAQFDEAKKARQQFLSVAEVDGEDELFNLASGLMLDKRFDDCIAAYRKLMERFPKHAGECESQIGAAQFFLGQLDEAIASYLRALQLGADKGMMDDNVFEACEALAKQSGTTAPYQRYLKEFPQGKYVKAAKKKVG